MSARAELTRCACGTWSYSQPCGVCRATSPDWAEREQRAMQAWRQVQHALSWRQQRQRRNVAARVRWLAMAHHARVISRQRQQAEQDLADWLAQDVH